MSIIAQRTVGPILIAFDDGASPPTDTTPVGSLVTVADGTLWISTGGGSYTQASGGGGLGDATVWPTAANWAALQVSDVREGDIQAVADIDGFGSGVARYGGTEWEVFQADTASFANLEAIDAARPVRLGAIGRVASAVLYEYDGADWARTPESYGYRYPNTANWASLQSLDFVLAGDIQGVNNLGTTNSTGFAQYSGTEWELTLGYFETVADKDAFAFPVADGANLFVGAPLTLTPAGEIAVVLVDTMPNMVFVKSKSDFPAPSAGVITLSADTTYYVIADVDLTGDRLVAQSGTSIIGASNDNSSLSSTGLSSNAMITSTWPLVMRDITIDAGGLTGSAAAFSLIAGGANRAISWTNVNVDNAVIAGTFSGYTNLLFNNCGFRTSAELKFDGTMDSIGFFSCIFTPPAASVAVRLESTLVINRRVRFIYSAFVITSGMTGILVESLATFPNPQTFILDTVSFGGGGTYLTGITTFDTASLVVACTGVINTTSALEYYMANNATATTIAVSGTYVKVAGTTTVGAIAQQFTHTNNRATFTGGVNGVFRVLAFLNATGSNGNQIVFRIAKNGTTIVSTTQKMTLGSAGSIENIGIQAIVDLASGDFVEVWVTNLTNTNSVTVTDMNVSVLRAL